MCIRDSIYTRFLWVAPLVDKEEQTVLDGFNDIIKSLDQKPLYLCTDLGIFLGCAAILAAAQPLKIVFVVVVVLLLLLL